MLDHIWVAIGVNHCDYWNTKFVGFGHRDVLTHRIEHKDGIRQALHVLNATEIPLQLLEFARQQQCLLFRHRFELTRIAHPLVVRHLGDPFGDRLKVGQHAAQPPLVDVWHATFLGVRADRILRLALGADKQNPATIGDEVANEGVGRLNLFESLLEVNDVDPRPLAVDKTLHPRVPATGLVSKVDTRLKQLLHGHDSHSRGLLPIGSSRPLLAPVGDRGWVGVNWSVPTPCVSERSSSVPATGQHHFCGFRLEPSPAESLPGPNDWAAA